MATVRVHYIGVTTPETMHPPGPGLWPSEAAEASRTLVEGRTVRLGSMSNSGIAISSCWPTCTWATS